MLECTVVPFLDIWNRIWISCPWMALLRIFIFSLVLLKEFQMQSLFFKAHLKMTNEVIKKKNKPPPLNPK